jgi:hypothetical protein
MDIETVGVGLDCWARTPVWFSRHRVCRQALTTNAGVHRRAIRIWWNAPVFRQAVTGGLSLRAGRSNPWRAATL